MAYPTVSSPYGLKPINLIGGQPYAGSTRAFKIASGYNQNIFYGDVVKIKRITTPLLGGSSFGAPVDGTIEVQKTSGAGYVQGEEDISFVPGILPFAVGVFMGCSYTDPVLKYKLFSQYYPAGLVADDIEAYVVDDPDALFKVVMLIDVNTYEGPTTGIVTGTTVTSGEGANIWGGNGIWVYNGGDTDTGNSLSGLAIDPVPYSDEIQVYQTNAFPFRVVGVVPETATSTGFVEAIVKFNTPALISGEIGGGHEYQWPGVNPTYLG